MSRGRPSQFSLERTENNNQLVEQWVLGQPVSEIPQDRLADRLEECVVRNSQQSRKCQTYVAMALTLIRRYETFRGAYRNWDEFITAMTVRNQTFASSRHAARYIHAVTKWIEELGYEPGLLERFGPSILGEIAQAGVLDGEDAPIKAQAWIRMLETMTVTKVRNAIKEERLLLDAPDIEYEDQAETYDPNTEAEASEDNEQDQNAVEVADTNIEIAIIECRSPAGQEFYTTMIRRNGTIINRFTSTRRPSVREALEAEVSELRRELRNLRAEHELTEELNRTED